MSNRGIVYLLCGMKCAERLAVSLFTLRQHWHGDITVMTRTSEEEELARKIALTIGCRVMRIRDLSQRAMLAKTMIPDWTPYEDTLFIDADTIVVGPVDEMFGHPLTLTQYATWQSNKRMTKKWIGRWYNRLCVMVDNPVNEYAAMALDQMNNPYPAINTGVFAFQRDNANLVAWQQLSNLYPSAWAVDQLAMQILTSVIPHRMMDDRFNNSATHGHETVDVRIVHWHGGKHCGSRKCAKQWQDVFTQAYDANVGDLQEWAGRYDKSVRNWMEEV